MEFIIIILALIALVFAYFFFGMILKLAWGWLPFVVGMLGVLILAMAGSWLAALVGAILFIAVPLMTNGWHSTALYQYGEALIDRTFGLGD